MAYKVIELANCLINKDNNETNGDNMTNLKLQKMLYYLQGYYLAVFNKPLFEEDIEACIY